MEHNKFNNELLKLFKLYDKEAGTNLVESWVNESLETKEVYLKTAQAEAKEFENYFKPLTNLFFISSKYVAGYPSL